MKTPNIFDKIFVLDTNIILNNSQNILTLSQNGNNLIILPETVIDEIDSKKTGLEEINWQAREFARLLYDAKIDEQEDLKDLKLVKINVSNITIYIVSKLHYNSENETQLSIKNDRKILEITNDLRQDERFKNLKFISLDIMARTRALSLGIDTEPLLLNKDVDADIDFHLCLEIDDFNGNIKEIPETEDHISSIEIENEKGRTFVYYKNNIGWTLIDDKNERKLALPPINKKQKVMTEIILDNNEIIVATGPAGTGKNVTALSAAMKLVDTNTPFKKIYYIRRTVISGTNEDELGFLPGTLEEKTRGYNQPMEDAIRKIAKIRKKDQTPEELEERIAAIREKYCIEYLYAGHLRGTTLDEGSILIIDEIQNFDIASARTIVSRVGKDSKVIALGSNNQIDSKYLTRNTNALTFLMNKCGQENTSDIKIKGVKLTNVMRSKIAEWADIHLY